MPMLGWRASKLQQNTDENRGRKLPERGTSAGREARESIGAAPLLLTYEGRGVNFSERANLGEGLGSCWTVVFSHKYANFSFGGIISFLLEML